MPDGRRDRTTRGKGKPGGRRRAAGRGKMRIRMYRQGIGDCFLLTVSGGRRPFSMLVDCGILLGSANAQDVMRKVAEDIGTTAGGRLDVVVGTHEHWDHLSGFVQARNVFDGIKMGEVWLAWTEDPRDALARRLREDRAARQRALHLALDRWKTSGIRPLALDKVTSLVESFGGPLAAGGKTGTSDALQYLVDRGKKGSGIRYLDPGEVFIPDGAPGVRVYVLGPPRDPAHIRKREPTKKGHETYEEAALVSAFEAGLSAALGAGAADGGTGGGPSAGCPFEAPYRVTPEKAGSLPFFREHYGFGRSGSADAAPWRRIDDDWVAAAGELALDLDNETNNTSLVLAIEIAGTGDVILLAADAQVGNWESWKDHTWKVEDGKGEARQVRAKDLLERAVVYKVGHHGSHNATLRAEGLELMENRGLMALVPVDHDMAVKKKWNMPFPPLLERLEQKCRGRVIRGDAGLPSDGDGGGMEGLDQASRKAFKAAVTQTELYVDVEVPMG